MMIQQHVMKGQRNLKINQNHNMMKALKGLKQLHIKQKVRLNNILPLQNED